jgi:hypothetical protein
MDMSFIVHMLYAWATFMLVCKVASEWWMSYFIPMELALTCLLFFQFYKLFNESLLHKEVAMMDVKSTLLAKLIFFTWLGMVQISWSKESSPSAFNHRSAYRIFARYRRYNFGERDINDHNDV